MAAPALATTTFESGADDGLRVKDVYESSGSGVVNSYQEEHPEVIDVLDTVTGGGGGDGSGGGGTDDDPIDPSSVDQEPLASNNDLADIFESQDDFVDAIPEMDYAALLPDSDLGSYLSELSENMLAQLPLDKSALQGLTATVNGVESTLNNALDIRSVQALGNIVNQLACDGYNLAVNGLNALSSLIAGVAGLASRIGLPDVFGSISNCAGNQPSVLANAVRIMAPSVVARANIPLLNDIARSGYGSALNRAVPGIVNQTLSRVGVPAGMTRQAYPGYYNTARESFGRVDNDWNRTLRSGSSILDGTGLSTSGFFRDTLNASVMDRTISVRPSTSGVMDVFPNYGEDRRAINTSDFRTGEDEMRYRARVGDERNNDSYLAAASSFGRQSVDRYLGTAFRNVGAQVNRSFNY